MAGYFVMGFEPKFVIGFLIPLISPSLGLSTSVTPCGFFNGQRLFKRSRTTPHCKGVYFMSRRGESNFGTPPHEFPVPSKMAASLVKDVTEILDRTGTAETKKGVENYLKNAVSRGNKVPAIKSAALTTLRAATSASPNDIYAAAFLLLVSKICDDKYAGLVYLSSKLIQNEAIFDSVNLALRDRLLSDVAALFDCGFVTNWSECDGLCGHVIGPFVARHPHRRRIADTVLSWSHADHATSSVWKRRAGHVSFVSLVRSRPSAARSRPPPAPSPEDGLPAFSRGLGGDLLFGAGFVSSLIGACQAALASPDRFAQTGGGWVMRYCLLERPAAAAAALRAVGRGMSREGMRYALEQCPTPALRAELLALPQSRPDAAAAAASGGGGEEMAGGGNGPGGGGKRKSRARAPAAAAAAVAATGDSAATPQPAAASTPAPAMASTPPAARSLAAPRKKSPAAGERGAGDEGSAGDPAPARASKRARAGRGKGGLP